LKTLTQADATHSPLFLQSECLFTGLYVNELFYRLLHEYDPHEHLYDQYQQYFAHMSSGQLSELKLRQLEMCLLEELGYGLAIDTEAESGESLDADKFYKYIPELGLVECSNQSKATPGVFRGSDLMALSESEFDRKSVILAAKQLLRSVIDFYLDGRKLHSRELYRQHLANSVAQD